MNIERKPDALHPEYVTYEQVGRVNHHVQNGVTYVQAVINENAPHGSLLYVAKDAGSQVHPESALPSRPAISDDTCQLLHNHGVWHADDIEAIVEHFRQKFAPAVPQPGVERRRDQATAKLPLDVECALEHAAVALDQVRQRMLAVIQQHLP